MHFLLRSRPAFGLIKHIRCTARRELPIDLVQSHRFASSVPGLGFVNELFLDLSKSSWVANTQHLIESVHEYTHLPWWGTIVVTTVSLRLLVTLPLAAYQVCDHIFLNDSSNNHLVVSACHLRQTRKPQARDG